MNMLEKRRAEATAARKQWGDPDPRREKRWLTQNGGRTDLAVEQAYLLGCDASLRRRPARNPFPAGRRHDEFERGLREADPMGDHHGRNV